MDDKHKVTINGRRVEGIYRFAANEWPHEDACDSVRDALTEFRDELLETAKNVNLILQSEIPEKAEALMTDNPMFQVNEVVLTAPDISPDKVKQSIHTFLQEIIKQDEMSNEG
jgi:hypothetical protein